MRPHTAAQAVHALVAAAAEAAAASGTPLGAGAAVDLDALPAAELRRLDEALDEGEVDIELGAAGGGRVREACLPGLWREQGPRADGGRRRLAFGAMSPLVLDAVAASGTVGFTLPAMPEGVMNAEPVLRDLHAWLEEPLKDGGGRGGERVIPLTHLPLTPLDRAVIDDALGTGPVTMVAKGYGDCRIASTAVRGVWHLWHENYDGKVLLETYEVARVPDAALATGEDLADTAARLAALAAQLA